MEALMAGLAAGDISFATAPVWLILALLCGAVGGAVSALKLGGADIGRDIALIMGSIFGPVASIPGVLIALIVLKFI